MGRKANRKKQAREEGAASPPVAAAPKVDGRPVAVSDATFDREVVESELPVVVDFWAPWCGPCKAIAPILEQVAGDMAGRVKVVKYDTERNGAVSQAMNIRSIPTLVLFKDGEVADALIGAVGPARLQAWIERGIAPKRSLVDRLLGR